MCTCDSSSITSTQGPKGDPGPSGGTFTETLYNSAPVGGTDIYNSGTGVVIPVLPSKTNNGILSYDGVINVSSTGAGLVTITPFNAGVSVDANIIRATYPAAVAGASYISIPISGSITMTDRTAFSLNILGSNAITAKYTSINIKLKQY